MSPLLPSPFISPLYGFLCSLLFFVVAIDGVAFLWSLLMGQLLLFSVGMDLSPSAFIGRF